MQNRRCAVCNTLNGDSAVYCKRCRSFLRGRAAPGGQRFPIPSIWEQDSGRRTDETAAGAGRKQSFGGWIAVCPDCQTRTQLQDGRMPLLCEVCGYFFQPADRPVRANAPRRRPEGAGRDGAGTEGRPPAPAKPSPMSGRREEGPMRRGRADESALRLISLSPRLSFVLTARAEGSILGARGNLEPELFQGGVFRGLAPQHLMLWHTGTGWYLRPLAGRTIHNGQALNQGVSRKLSDGDLLNAGDCSLRVEIVPALP